MKTVALFVVTTLLAFVVGVESVAHCPFLKHHVLKCPCCCKDACPKKNDCCPCVCGCADGKKCTCTKCPCTCGCDKTGVCTCNGKACEKKLPCCEK